MLPPNQNYLTRGILIVVDGIDGAGKTTQAQLLAKKYINQGFAVTQTKEPTNSFWGKKIRKIAQYGRKNISPEYELNLFMKDRDQDVSRVIVPALEKKHMVIADRYYYSTIAYQGALGIDPEYIKQINEEKFPRPDIAILLDVPPGVGLLRILEGRREKNNIGFEQKPFLIEVRKIFKKLRRDPIVQEIDATPSIQVVFKNIVNLTDNMIRLSLGAENELSGSVNTNLRAIPPKQKYTKQVGRIK